MSFYARPHKSHVDVSTLLPCLVLIAGCADSTSEDQHANAPATIPNTAVVHQPRDDPGSFHGLRDRVSNTTAEFGVFWPPVDPGRPPGGSNQPLLWGTLSVFETSQDRLSSAFRLDVTLRRQHSEDDRLRWNKTLAFPEHDWMAEVRVWDRDQKWLWPNLPFLLRAYGQERVERYGGVDPGKGIDNDFAAVLVRPPAHEQSGAHKSDASNTTQPLVSAEWHAVDAESLDGRSVVHVARSDEFRVRVSQDGGQAESGKLGVWLIYADFLGARTPRNWPSIGEWAGGILAYFEVTWRRSANGNIEFGIEHLVPPTDTGFDWRSWSAAPSARQRRLELIDPIRVTE